MLNPHHLNHFTIYISHSFIPILQSEYGIGSPLASLTSAMINPFSKSVWILPPACGALEPFCEGRGYYHSQHSVGRLCGKLYKIEGPRTRVGQPEMKYWKLHKLQKKNEVKNVHPYRIAGKFGGH